MSGVALILGVGPGIGNAVAKQWASKGFKVACVARNPEKVR
jgi:NAD(P)-dependent dehydrogenase (short-subunit alcohol dehydrogenase family)